VPQVVPGTTSGSSEFRKEPCAVLYFRKVRRYRLSANRKALEWEVLSSWQSGAEAPQIFGDIVVSEFVAAAMQPNRIAASGVHLLLRFQSSR
jgi:hypothetical protein